ncbi:MAG: 4-hydroxy-tetrahydrodipicolinate synthase, partial [Flavobacteriales bacterium]
MMNKKLEGTGVAIVTPFAENGSVDYSGLENLVRHLIDNGIDYLVVQGTTGESATLTKEEKKEVLSCVQDVNEGRLPLVLGIGGNNTAAVTDDLGHFDLSAVDAILSVSPYYNKPTQEGIFRHYRTLAECSPLPLLLYNVPGRTASNISAETTLRLAEACPNIVAVKEASGDLEQIGRIIGNCPKDFLVISGDDALTLPMLSIGGRGVISVLANVLPGQFSDMVRSALQGDFASARET